jgi:hypothetical protein
MRTQRQKAPAAQTAPPPTGAAQSILPWRDFLSLDIRSLAVMRIGLGLVLLGDWLQRLPDLSAHATDTGVMPRSLVAGLPLVPPISIHFYSGEVWYQALLAGIALIAALSFLVGYKTPLANFVSWFLLISVHARTPFTLQGGDTLLRMALFWGLFLPLGACYSVDAAHPSRRPASFRVLSLASVALILQMVLVYWFAAVWKWAPEWRSEGTAVHMALQVEHFTTRAGRFVRDYPTLCWLLTHATIYLETLGPVMLFIPFYPSLLRLLTVCSFILFHAGLFVTMELINFPWVCSVCWLGLLPTEFWERIRAQLRTPEQTRLLLVYDPGHGGAKRLLTWLQMLLVLPDARLESTASLPERFSDAAAALREHGGWMVLTHQGRPLFQVEALEWLVRLSPLFWLTAWLFHSSAVRWLAGRLLRWFGGSTGTRSEPTSSSPAWRPAGGIAVQCVVACCLIYVMLWNISTLDRPPEDPESGRFPVVLADLWATGAEPQASTPWVLVLQAARLGRLSGEPIALSTERFGFLLPAPMRPLGRALALDQGWGLFAPAPGKVHGWYLAVAYQKNGRRVDALHGGLLREGRPELVSATYPTGRWRQLMMTMPYHNGLLANVARYLFEEWNRRHTGDEQLVGLELLWIREVSVRPGEEPVKPAVGTYRYPPESPTPP